jgi:carboxypeptidase family protein
MMSSRDIGAAALLAFVLFQLPAIAADHYGQVTFTGLPVPGATVTATQGDKALVAITDASGIYKLSGLSDGSWSIRVEMLGFAPQTQDVAVSSEPLPATFALKLLPFEEIKKVSTISAVAAPAIVAAGPAPSGSGDRRSETAASAPPPPPADPDLERDAADGFLINGSVNNGAASPFAQARAFGNNRAGQRNVYNGEFGINFGNSMWDSRPFSFARARADKPDYTDVHVVGAFGGTLRIPRLLRNGPVFYIGVQRTADHTASTQTALMPTAKERGGDFSETRDGFGRPVQLLDPQTGRPFPGNKIPADRISSQASALLAYYPQANVADGERYNYQSIVESTTTVHSLQSRFNQNLTNRTSINGGVAHRRTNADNSSIFGFLDRNVASATDVSIGWSRRFSLFFSMRAGYQLLRQTSRVTPYFANRTDVSAHAGIAGNSHDPADWGPPSLTFASGMAGLSDASPVVSETETHNFSSEAVWRPRGRHTITFGGAYRPQVYDVTSQQNPRGTFGFTGATTGYDVADFLIGSPHTGAIAFGNADKRFRAPAANAYISDDWRLNPSLTINAGVRWEYEGPFTEKLGRLVNLNVDERFTTATQVIASPSQSLLASDMRGVQPRLAVAWRPVPASSLVVRAGYGIYRNTSVYQSIVLTLAQQAPLSKSFSVENSAATPLTLANGFNVGPVSGANTFAVDPEFRVGYAHNWQISLQRDLPASLTVTATYLGTKGSHLMQEFVPNTYPAGSVNPCPACPTGFIYLVSNGRSLRNAAQLQIRRRLRAGLTATAQYTLSKATDDAGAFAGADLNGASVAQDWLDLAAEYAPSNFDQRHVLTAQFEYSPRLLFRNFTFSGQLTAASGMPLTPVYLTSLAGTGVVGTVRAEYTGQPVAPLQPGYYVNPAAFEIPVAGKWGSAGRNSITGPSQFTFNMAVLRTFALNSRWSADWKLDAANVLNRVTYSGVEMRVGSPQFGLANRANPMRKLQTSIRLRF